MQYYSTNKQAPDVTLEEAVVKGLAADKGLFMPFTIKPLPQEFYDSIDTLGFQEIAYRVADAFFGEYFFFQAEDGIRDYKVTGVQTCALPI